MSEIDDLKAENERLQEDFRQVLEHKNMVEKLYQNCQKGSNATTDAYLDEREEWQANAKFAHDRLITYQRRMWTLQQKVLESQKAANTKMATATELENRFWAGAAAALSEVFGLIDKAINSNDDLPPTND